MNFCRFVFMPVLVTALIASKVDAQPYEPVNFDTEDGGKIEASFFKAGGNKAVIFAHGAIFSAQSPI